MEIISLGNRNYRIIETHTLELVIWMDRQVLECGLAKMLQVGAQHAAPLQEDGGSPGRAQHAAPLREAEAAGEYAGRVWEAISRSGKVFALLGGMIIPDELADTDWAPAWAEKTGEALKKLTAPEDIARVRSLLVSLVLGFFVAARHSSALSGIASPSVVRAVQ